jgi:hypothetical protein
MVKPNQGKRDNVPIITKIFRRSIEFLSSFTPYSKNIFVLFVPSIVVLYSISMRIYLPINARTVQL